MQNKKLIAIKRSILHGHGRYSSAQWLHLGSDNMLLDANPVHTKVAIFMNNKNPMPGTDLPVQTLSRLHLMKFNTPTVSYCACPSS
jgi:hypothetical protein